MVSILGASSLTSRFKLSNSIQGFLPSTQWQLDVQNWYSIMLSVFQQSMITTVLGDQPAYSDSDNAENIAYAESEEAKAICSNQVFITQQRPCRFLPFQNSSH